MTERLYYSDSRLTSFDATVQSCDATGDRFELRLDRTAFYPTSGGQPFDTGRLNDVRVVDVVDRDDGEILHVTEGAIPVGTTVHGEIDWARRLDHMQQHTGQHLLSAAFDRLFGARTESFHLGADTSTIDLAREVSPKEINRAEDAANAVVWDDRGVEIRYATDDEAARLPLRKESQRTGKLRLISVPDFDLSACGGTHVPRTGSIGIIAVSGWERFKGGSRISFVCGGRALAAYRTARDVVTGATRALSIAPADLGATIERFRAESKDLSRAVKDLRTEVAGYRAAALRETAETSGVGRGVLRHEPGWDASALKSLALAIVSEPGFVVVLAGDGQPAPVVVARSADRDFDSGRWMQGAAAALGGRGGGRPELAQGGLASDPASVLEYARITILNA
jgi:alanyl-tRNA synthetase